MKRIVSTVAVTLASGALVVGTGSAFGGASAGAVAAPDGPEVRTTAVADDSTNLAPRRKRWISIRVGNVGRQAFVRGHVGPKNQYRRKIVVVQRKACKRCKWKFHAKTRTNRKSNYRRNVNLPHNGKRWFFRARLPKSNITSKTLAAWWY